MQNVPSILFVLPWNMTTVGGVNQVVIHLAREAARRGKLRPIIIYNDWGCENFHVGEFEGITLVSAHLRTPLGNDNPVRNLAGFALRMRKDIKAWRTFIKHHNIQVINAHYAVPGYMLFAAMRALRSARFRLVYSLHGADLTAIIESGKTKRATNRWMLKQADQIVCCSNALTERTIETLKLDASSVSTIHNGIDLEELDSAKTLSYRPLTGEFDKYLINVATYEHKKGQDVLLDAYLQLVRDGLNAALVLVGRSTPYLSVLRSQVRKLALHNHVFFVPDLDHARTLAAIRKARLLVQPSREEPFGITLLEAAYMRCPIVASKTGGIPEVLGGYYPYLVTPDDAGALAQTIDDALFNPTETQHQIRLLRRRIANGFTWGKAYDTYEKCWLGPNN